MENTEPTRQVCGVCHDEWLTEAEYLNHTCPVSGFTPEQPEHLIATTTPDFAQIQEAAVERGNSDESVPAQPVAPPVTETPVTDAPAPAPTEQAVVDQLPQLQ
jgi:hypothetical protein